MCSSTEEGHGSGRRGYLGSVQFVFSCLEEIKEEQKEQKKRKTKASGFV